jgi:predicted peptidase
MRKLLLLFLTSSLLAACTGHPAVTPTPAAPPPPTSTATPIPDACLPVDGVIEQACANAATGLQYWLYHPESTAAGEKPPLLIYLHGFSHSGSQLGRLLSGGVPAEIERGRQLPMIVISPQCPAGENWQTSTMVERLSRFVDDVVAFYGADPQRVYLTGFSMGGDGVWALGKAHPEQFRALLPVASWYSNAKDICVLRDTPIRVYQSETDEIVSPQFARDLVAALQQCGGRKAALTMLPDASHEGTSRAVYAMDDMYQWLLDQK